MSTVSTFAWAVGGSLALTVATQAVDPAQRTVPSSESLRTETTTTIASMMSPCRYELEYANYMLAADSSIGRAFMPLMLGDVVGRPDTFERYRTSLERASSAEDAAKQGVRFATGIQRFHVEVGQGRVAQWCTSDPTFPSTLRTRDLEVTYFSEFRRLDFQNHTAGMYLFEPSFLISPLPSSASQLEYFRTAPWTSDSSTEGVLRIRAYRAENAQEWLALDVGAGSARLPYSCIAFRAGRGSRNGFSAVFSWTTKAGTTYWDGVLYVTDSGEELEISLFRRDRVSHEVRDSEVRLPVDQPKSIRDMIAGPARSISGLESLPDRWRALVSDPTRDIPGVGDGEKR